MHLKSDYKNLNPIMWSEHKPLPLKNPQLISKNEKLFKELELNLSDESLTKLINGQSDMDIEYFAMAYSGHQFGYFVDNLGDGRALNLGKLKEYNLQTKGSGATKYSRMGDGRAVLRSSIREYLLSEAMYGLGIPTSRAIGIISSDTTVYREDNEMCAIVLRAASSWIRFGTFEFAYLQENPELIKQLANYVIDESYPKLKGVENRYEELYFAIVDNTIELMAKWQSVGFMHGVMNSDNMSIAGLTIDYGPFAMMEEFDKGFICNLSDKQGRYSFDNQPFIAGWNLSVLAKVLSPIANHKIMEKYNNMFIGKFKKRYFTLMKQKLGLYNNTIDDTKLILNLFKAMGEDKIDYTLFFYSLSTDSLDLKGNHINAWLKEYSQRLEQESTLKEDRLAHMRKINPKYILRNYMLQDAIDAAQKGDFKLINDFLKIAQNPFGDFPKYEHYTKPNKDFKSMKCSCSS